MRICLFAFLLLAFYSISFSQDLPDSLGKYSYLVQIDKRCMKSQSTGFFARYQQRLFFITTARYIAGWEKPGVETVENKPDSIYIRLSNDTSKVSYLSLPVAGIKKSTKTLQSTGSPDMIVIEIKNAKKYDVYSIESFFQE